MIPLAWFAAAAALLLPQETASKPGAESKPASEELTSAVQLFAMERFDDALARLELLLAGSVDSRTRTKARQLRGLIFIEQHRYAEAAQALGSAREEEPKDAVTLVSLARAKEMLGSVEEAQALLQEALAVAPASADVLFAAGQFAHRRRDDNKTKLWLSQALAADPWSDSAASAHYALAAVAQRVGDDAGAAAQRALYKEKFDFSTKRTALAKRLAVSPGDVKAARALGQLYLHARLGRLALPLLEPIARGSRDRGLLLEWCDAALLCSDWERAQEAATQALAADPSGPSAHRRLAEAFTHLDKLEDAASHWAQALAAGTALSRDPSLRELGSQIEVKAKAAGKGDLARRVAEILRRLGK
ncbi:MAG: tetratricopeptide repeat protein [Planctomycetes bacterium]|nr:tetratricopeptide repeat protein [Planctomycetota bacterium]